MSHLSVLHWIISHVLRPVLLCGMAVVLFSTLWSTRLGSVRAEEIDRVLATVNGRIITESDLRVSRDLNLLLQYGTRRGAEPSRDDELKRLIDLELVRQELENFPLAADDKSGIDAQITELRTAYAEVGGLGVLLNRLGLQEEELVSYLRLQASIKRFVEVRFNPFVTVSAAEVEDYYRKDLVPRLEKSGAAVPALSQVSKSIEELLTETKVNASLENWIQGVRGTSKIEYFAESGERSASPKSIPQAAAETRSAPDAKVPPGIGRIKQ